MVRVGCHVSIAGSLDRAVDRAMDRGCDTFQIFSRNPRGWKSKPLDAKVVDEFIRKVNESGIEPVFSHMPYLPNLASPKPDVYERSVATLTHELERCTQLAIPYLITHLGSHLGEGREGGIDRLVHAVNHSLDAAGGGVMLLLENTAGTQNSIGGTFEDIARIIDGIRHRHRIGVCFDTCHAFAAGYDISSPTGLNETIHQFDRTIGLERLKVIHLNDSKGECGSALDRHEHIGMGYIGEEGFRRFLQHKKLRDLPMICETPVDDRRDDRGNIEKVRELAG